MMNDVPNGPVQTPIAIQNSGLVSVFRGIAHGLFAPEQRFGVGSFPLGLLVDDLDGDGDPDLAVTNSGSDDVTVLLHRD